MAEKENLDLVAPCSACYKNTFFTNRYLQQDADMAEHINFALKEDDLEFSGTIAVRHLIEVFTEDVGLEEVQEKVTQPLQDLRVAPYYGCQIIRPKKDDEEIEQPQFFESLLSSLGAEAVDYALKTRCCGGSLLISSREAALSMIHKLLLNAEESNADVIATACPLCQLNLECYQNQVNQEYGTNFNTPVVYFTQLMGLAFGIPNKRLGIGSELIAATTLAPFAVK
jgi:heterodisulfide reductase subunit B